MSCMAASRSARRKLNLWIWYTSTREHGTTRSSPRTPVENPRMRANRREYFSFAQISLIRGLSGQSSTDALAEGGVYVPHTDCGMQTGSLVVQPGAEPLSRFHSCI